MTDQTEPTPAVTLSSVLELWNRTRPVVAVHPTVRPDLEAVLRDIPNSDRIRLVETDHLPAGTVLVCHPNRLEPNLRTGLDQTSSETPGGIREPSSRVRAVSQPEDETAGA